MVFNIVDHEVESMGKRLKNAFDQGGRGVALGLSLAYFFSQIDGSGRIERRIMAVVGLFDAPHVGRGMNGVVVREVEWHNDQRPFCAEQSGTFPNECYVGVSFKVLLGAVACDHAQAVIRQWNVSRIAADGVSMRAFLKV